MPLRDRVLATFLILPVGLILLGLVPLILICHGRPLFYISRRIGQDGQPFALWKLRTMAQSDRAESVLGGEAMDDITDIGRWLRRTRLDELPQLYNLLRGDMVFVGPRPPLPRYVDAYPEIYLPLLAAPPGITGLATVVFCKREEAILACAETPNEVDELYRRRCLLQKARLDALYRERSGPFLTLSILVLTLVRGPAAHNHSRRFRHWVERVAGLRKRP